MLWRIALVLSLLLLSSSAWARVSLCLDVKADATELAGFERLVRSELERHPSHAIATSNCDSRLLVELFTLSGTRYLTLRIDGDIPQRFRVPNQSEIELRLADGISRALRNDPSYLAEDPRRISATDRVLRSLLVRGNNYYRLALFETAARTDTGVAFAPGAAFEFLRGADHYSLIGRLALSAQPGAVSGDERALRLLGQLEVGLNYEFSQSAAVSPYVGAGVGAALMSFEGRVNRADVRSLDRVTTTGASLQLRAGVRFLRLYDFDADFFVLGVLPFFATKNEDAVLFGEKGIYTPFVQAGLSVGF